MSKETLVTTRRAIVTAAGALAMNALLPLTAFAGRRRRECCTPAAAPNCSPCMTIYSIGLTQPPSGLVIEEPRGKTITIAGSFNLTTNWPIRVILTVQATCFSVQTAPTDENPAGWAIYAPPPPNPPNPITFTKDVVIDNNVPQGNLLFQMGPFWASAVAQVKDPMMPLMWRSVDAGVTGLYGHKRAPGDP